WPEDVFGKIDGEKAKRGAEVYRREGCAKCHAEKPPYPETAANKYGKRFVLVNKVPLAEVKTDPAAAEEFANRTAKTGRLAPLLGNRTDATGPELFFTIAGGALEAELKKLKLPADEVLRLNGYRDAVLPSQQGLLGYRAAPLAGVW